MSRNEEVETQLREVARRYDRVFPHTPMLKRDIMRRVGRERPAQRATRFRLLGEMALAGVLVCGSVALGIGLSHARGSPVVHLRSASSALPKATPSPTPRPRLSVPQPLIDEAALSNVANLITPEEQPVSMGPQTATLIGAYADPARTILFFRLQANGTIPDINIAGINASGTSGSRLAGYFYYALDGGPALSADGLAHLSVEAHPMATGSFTGPPPNSAVFELAVRVYPATSLPAPAKLRAGSWTVTMEKLEATPAVIHIEAVVDGLTPGTLQMDTVTAVDAAGQPLRQVAGGAGITVPKQALTASTVKNARIDFQWLRPIAAGPYLIRIKGPQGTGTISVDLAALAS
jgi:hypothetical protein